MRKMNTAEMLDYLVEAFKRDSVRNWLAENPGRVRRVIFNVFKAGKDRKGNTINEPHAGEFGHHYALDKSAAIPDGDREEVFARLKERLSR